MLLTNLPFLQKLWDKGIDITCVSPKLNQDARSMRERRKIIGVAHSRTFSSNGVLRTRWIALDFRQNHR